MILFKRVGESFRHIEDREWVLLVLETLGVLVGILLAFELQEWGQRRSEAAKHRQLMERLFEESELDVALLRNFRTDALKIAAKEQNFASQLSAGQCPAEGAWSAVVTTNMYPPITVPSGVYEELMGAGGLSSIEDASVRKAVEGFRGYLDLAARQSDLFHSSRAAGGRTAIEVDDPRVTVRYDTSADEPEIIRYDRAPLCADKAFRNRMIDAVRDHGIIMSRHSELTDLAIGMCAKLGRLVGEQCLPAFGGVLTGADARLAAKAARERTDVKPMLRAPSRSASPSKPDAGRDRG